MRGWPGAGQRVGNGQLMLNGYSFCLWWQKSSRKVVTYPKLFAWDTFLQVELICQKIFVWNRHMYPLFIAALFTIARTWKQPRCPSTDQWIKKMWCIHIMEYYSAIKECIWVSSNEIDEPCCGSWGRKESDMTEWLNWTEIVRETVGGGGSE